MSVGSGRDAVVAAARRSPCHSSLFWFLFDQHDELIEAKKLSGLGIPWESMLARFAALNLKLCQGKAITARTARQTFLRVQKKKARLAALEAKAEAARAFERARDPRRNMPSRFTGSFPAPLSDRQPPPPPPPPSLVSPPKAGTAVAIVGGGDEGGAIRLMPGGPVLTGGFEDKVPAEFFTVEFKGEPLDIRLFIRPGEERSWELPGVDEVGWARVLKQRLLARFDSWVRDRVGDPNNPIDVDWRKRLGKP
ncbi:MAG TPA: hypothetical protein VGG79_04360 [Roseiarcus sp.]|jgi:hypothetical protein